MQVVEAELLFEKIETEIYTIHPNILLLTHDFLLISPLMISIVVCCPNSHYSLSSFPNSSRGDDYNRNNRITVHLLRI